MPFGTEKFSSGYRGSKGKGRKRASARKTRTFNVSPEEMGFKTPGRAAKKAAADYSRGGLPDLPAILAQAQSEAPPTTARGAGAPIISALQLSPTQEARMRTPQELYQAVLRDPFKTRVDPETFYGFYEDRETAERALDVVEKARQKAIRAREDLGEPSDLTDAILAGAGIGGLVRSAVKSGARVIAGGATKRAATEAAEEGARRLGLKEALKATAARAEPQAVRAARDAAGRTAKKVPKPVRTAARTGARVGSYPIRHPIQAPFAAAVPQGVVQGDPSGALTGAVEGTGLYAQLMGAVGGLPGEALSIPASVVPGVFLGGRALVNAGQGDSRELEDLFEEWRDTGLLPALAEGDLGEAARRFGEHPLYGGLEASGALNAAGRTLGAGLRATPGVHIADIKMRPDLPVEGTRYAVKRGTYSRDALRMALQKLWERTTPGERVKAGSHRAAHYEKQYANRRQSGSERVRRQQNRFDLEFLNEVMPRRGVKIGGRKRGPLDRRTAEVVHLAVQRIIESPETFHADLAHYRDLIDDAYERKVVDKNGRVHYELNPEQRRMNRRIRKQIDAALEVDNPKRIQAVVDAANAFIERQQGILEKLVERGHLTPEQAEMASLYPFARIHMGAGYGRPRTIDDLGETLKRLKGAFKEQARERVRGFVDARDRANANVKKAEAAYVQAERDYARLRASLSEGARETRRSGDGGPHSIRYDQRIEGGSRFAGPLNRLEVARRAVDFTKQRLSDAKREAREGKAALSAEVKRLREERKERLAPTEAELKYHEGIGERLLDKEGNPLTREQVLAEMERRGVGRPGFISHMEPRAGDHYQPTATGARLGGGKRTGASILSGAVEGGVDALVRQMAKTRGLIHRGEIWDDVISKDAWVVPEAPTAAEAMAVINNPARFGLPADAELVAVPRYAFGARKAEIDAALEHQDPAIADDLLAGAHHAELRDTLEFSAGRGTLDPETKVAFMPKKMAEQWLADTRPTGGPTKIAQAITNLFKRTVLPFSPGFYAGNAFDNTMRLLLAGVNPIHMAIGHFALRRADDAKRANLDQGAHFASVSNLAARRSIEAITSDYGKLNKVAREAAEWSRQRGATQATVKALPKFVAGASHYFMAVNKALTEDLPTRGVVGKMILNDMRATLGSWNAVIGHWRDIGKDFERKLNDPAEIVRFQKGIEEVLGNYSNMSPDARRVLTTVTPFFTWMRAAYKFVYATMPAHRSVSTGLITAMEQATAATREAWGLNPEGDEPLPDWMQGSIPLDDGGVAPVSNLNSFGYAAQGPLAALGRAVLPQTPLGLLYGIDWKGDPVEKSDQAAAIAWQMFGAFIPGFNLLVHKDKEDKISVEPKVSVGKTYDKSYVDYARQPREAIEVPAREGDSSSSGVDYGELFGGGGSSGGVDYAELFGGGG